ncbi:hypothetical protein FGG08_006184 [Glutinoglossum americanum]|uniref:Shelterin complex subunit TPP1/Est3 domain-containing protein n=1 Tax=Glutinoglossum americanum TaxID=1670608 RepID=A0A9P8HWK9_9PEZI|nr:hypothetical protein FGG08_006184 [Glutinoglossum americanum]
MDELRKPWLGRVMRDTLEEIIQWRSSDWPARTKGNYRVVDDSVCVSMGRCNPLQILKFLTFGGEIQAHLSDTERYIDAAFSFAAVDAEKTRRGRRFTEGTAGGIIFIRDYEIRVRCCAGAPKLTLYVHQAELAGSGSGGTFGDPTHIGSDRGIKTLLTMVSTLDLSDHEPAEYNAGIGKSAQSQGSCQFEEQHRSVSRVESQKEFATQIHQPRISTSDRRDAAHRSGVGTEQHGKFSVMAATDVSTRTKEKAKSNNLLGLLLPEKRVAVDRELLEKARLRITQKAPKDSSIALEMDPLSVADRGDARLGKSIRDPTPGIVNIVRTGSVAQTQTMGYVDHKEAGVVIKSHQEIGHIAKMDTGVVFQAAAPREGQAGIVVGGGPEIGPWAGMTQISRSEVRIPKDQEDLLCGKGCWIPPEPGNRFPVGNIPVPILRSLAAKAERSALGMKEAAEAAKDLTGAGFQSEGGSSSDSDTEVELEWSSSPIRPRSVWVDEMPVDSSPEGTRAAYNESQSGAVHQRLDQKESRRKREEALSDDQDSSPIAKRQRKGECSEKELRLVRKDGGHMPYQSSLRCQDPRDQKSHADQRSVGGRADSLTGGNTDKRLIGMSNPKSKEDNSLFGLRTLVPKSTLDSAFSPVDNGTQFSRSTLSSRPAEVASNGAVVEVERTEAELEIDSRNYPSRPEQLEPCFGATAEEVSHVLNTQDRSPVPGGDNDQSDSEEEHELEISLPSALGGEVNSLGFHHQTNLILSPHPPSTAPQPRVSVLQVKQTPYLHGEATKNTSRYSSPLVSRKETGSPVLHDNTYLSSDPVIPCTFPNAEGLAKDSVRINDKRGQAEDFSVSGFGQSNISPGSQIATEYRLHSQVLSPGEMSKGKESVAGSLGTESASRSPVQVGSLEGCDPREANLTADAMGEKQGQTGGYVGHEVYNDGEEGSGEGRNAIGASDKVMHKRQHFRTEEALQSKSRKRLKRFKLPPSFAFSQENRQFLDPLEIARNYRQEFFTSLSRQPSPVLELSPTSSLAKGGEQNSENTPINLENAKETEAESCAAGTLDTRGVDASTHEKTEGCVVENRVIAPVGRVVAYSGNGKGDHETPHSGLQDTARHGMEESYQVENVLPPAEKTTSVVLTESWPTPSQTSASKLAALPPTPNPPITGRRAAATGLTGLENIPSTAPPLEIASTTNSVAPRYSNGASRGRNNGVAVFIGHASVSASAKPGITDPAVAAKGSSPIGSVSRKDGRKSPHSNTFREKARLPEDCSAQNNSIERADKASRDSSAGYSSAVAPVEGSALLREFTGDIGTSSEPDTDARAMETLKNAAAIQRISGQDFAKAPPRSRNPPKLDGSTAQASEPRGSLRLSPKASSSKPSHKIPTVSASISSNTPFKTLLSSPAQMKPKSNVLDWLEKTSSVGSESADNVPDPPEQKWWHDRNTPFKEWSRAYVSLKSVKGAMGKVDREEGEITPPCVKMDVLGWSL